MQTAIAFAGVVLTDSSGNVLDTLWCDADGRFRIGYLEAGEYGLRPLVNLPWGGGNATDALLVMRHFVHLDTLAPTFAAAADVDASGLVNTTDALQIARRFASLMPAFASGDWFLPQQRINIEAGYYSLNLSVVCFGDVNGSYAVKAVMMKE
ncbi:MAG: hypothetical protein IH599_10335 [Bacteroidales bacterium]|nr:hypothetical protein [Bacteroidales bacterium]